MKWCKLRAIDVTDAECDECKMTCEQDAATAGEQDQENREAASREWEVDE